MTEAGIAYYGRGKSPYDVIRTAKNKANPGSSFKRELETLLKQDTNYLIKAFDYLIL
jgi:hypothetical protein